jgi:hypothetical protein
MFSFVNRFGNVYKEAKNEREKKELESLGYKQVVKEVSFDKMRVDELEQFALEKGIDLSGCTRKDEKIDAIVKAMAKNN